MLCLVRIDSKSLAMGVGKCPEIRPNMYRAVPPKLQLNAYTLSVLIGFELISVPYLAQVGNEKTILSPSGPVYQSKYQNGRLSGLSKEADRLHAFFFLPRLRF